MHALGEHLHLGRHPALVDQAQPGQDQQEAGADDGCDRGELGDLPICQDP
jgi:hypothetical protein